MNKYRTHNCSSGEDINKMFIAKWLMKRVMVIDSSI